MCDKITDEFGTLYTKEITCPSCGHEIQDSWELEDEGDEECEEC